MIEGRSDDGFALLGLQRTFRIVAIDGEDLKQGDLAGYPTSAEALPGRRRIEIDYKYTIDSNPGPRGRATLELDAVAGRTYRIEDRFGPQPTFTFVESAAAAR